MLAHATDGEQDTRHDAQSGTVAIADFPRDPDIIIEAQAAHDRGWLIMPLNAKIAIQKEWQRSPPPSTEQILQWAAEGNVGLRTGRASGVVVIDIDAGSSVTPDDYPSTVTVQTPGGGWHLYYKRPDCKRKIGNSAKHLPDHVDMRGDGGYVVYVGSIHPDTGTAYKWAEGKSPDEIEIAPLPSSLTPPDPAEEPPEPKSRPTAIPTPPRRNGYAHAALHKELDALSNAAEGTRNQRLNEAAFNLGQLVGAGHLARAEVELGLCEVARQIGLGSHEAAKTAKSGLDAGIAKPREIPQKTPPRPPMSTAAPGEPPTLDRPILLLPSDRTEIRESARQIGEAMAGKEFYARFAMLARVTNNEIELIEPPKACSAFEEAGDLHVEKIVRTEEGPRIRNFRRRCSTENAAKIIAADSFISAVPPIRAMSHCPVLLSDDRIIAGYDQATGIYAMGVSPREVSIDTAIHDLLALYDDYRFVTPADKARIVAGMLTPGMIYGDLLDGARSPAFGIEADASQAGKGYAIRVAAAVYNTRPHTIIQRKSGVGGIEEAIGGALIAGAPLVTFDNLRGKFDSPFVEAALTEPSIEARVAYRRGVIADPTHTAFAWTSNKAELTLDLANRSIIARIEKRDDADRFKSYPDDRDLLGHVQANQPHYLGCVFAVLREWMRRGRPAGCDPMRHDFYKWAGAMLWITSELFGLPDMLEGHRAVQRRTANQSENWLRDVALVAKQGGRLGEWVQAHDLLDLLEDSDVPIPGVRDGEDLADENTRHKALMALGRRLGKFFKKGESVSVERLSVTRRRDWTDDTQLREAWFHRFEETGDSPMRPITPDP